MEPFIGMIVMFGGNFAPKNWALCDGTLLSISNYQALFSILGTTYGGDGRTSFELPELRGRVPIHAGSGPGLSSYHLGQKSGQEDVTQVLSHTHTATVSLKAGLNAEIGPPNTNDPEGNMIASHGSTKAFKSYNANEDKLMAAEAITDTGTTVAIANTGATNLSNLQPYQAVNFIIALVGTYPSRN